MAQNIVAPPPQPIQHRRWGWLQTFLVGVLLFIITTIVLFLTGNPNLYPTVILIGNFLVPIVFVAFLYDHQHLSSLSTETIGRSFAVGGILGVLGASVLETILLPAPSSPDQGLTLGNALLVGLIEEGCKLIAIMFVARHMRQRTSIDGLLLGAAVGMGFAALESTGYAFTAFLTSHGHVGASIAETVLRCLCPLWSWSVERNSRGRPVSSKWSYTFPFQWGGHFHLYLRFGTTRTLGWPAADRLSVPCYPAGHSYSAGYGCAWHHWRNFACRNVQTRNASAHDTTTIGRQRRSQLVKEM